MGEETKKPVAGKKTIAAAAAGWLMAVLSIIYAVTMGGTAEFKVPCMNGGECLVMCDVQAGILELAKDCKFTKLGDSCEAKISCAAAYIKAGTEIVEISAEEAPLKKPDIDAEKTDTDTGSEDAPDIIEEKEEEAE